jgi:hypothetical protein
VVMKLTEETGLLDKLQWDTLASAVAHQYSTNMAIVHHIHKKKSEICDGIKESATKSAK